MTTILTTILVVEDNPTHLKLAKLLLEKAGYAVLTAADADAETGMQLAQVQQPDLIVLDIQLPDFDGLTATRRLKQNATTCAIPVIAVTAFQSDYTEKESSAAGCVALIAKPYHYQDFLTVVQAALNSRPEKEED
jgi:two-component system cell cycle response regulator DivK